MLTTTKSMLNKARKEGYAVGHFNTSNLEISKAIIEAAEELNSPVIVATSKSSIEYAGIKEISALVKIMAEKVDIPVALHLDHSPDFNLVKQCVDNGYTSVMIDASRFDYKKNVQLTKKVVKFAHPKVPVEAELGRLTGREGWVKSKKEYLTDPEEAKTFVKETDCDSLAISIGTSHGAFKFLGKAKLDIERLKEIKSKVNIPLVLHGASSVPKNLVVLANKYGAKIEHAQGIPDTQVKKAIKNGICKVNTDTDLRIAFDYAERKFLKENPKEFNPRKILGAATNELKKIVKQRIKLFGSSNKA